MSRAALWQQQILLNQKNSSRLEKELRCLEDLIGVAGSSDTISYDHIEATYLDGFPDLGARKDRVRG